MAFQVLCKGLPMTYSGNAPCIMLMAIYRTNSTFYSSPDPNVYRSIYCFPSLYMAGLPEQWEFNRHIHFKWKHNTIKFICSVLSSADASYFITNSLCHRAFAPWIRITTCAPIKPLPSEKNVNVGVYFSPANSSRYRTMLWTCMPNWYTICMWANDCHIIYQICRDKPL